MNRKNAITLVELCVLILALALLICLLRPVLGETSELAKRAVCAANLRAIGQACQLYAEANQGWFPHSLYDPAPGTPPNGHSVTFIGELSRDYTVQKTSGTWTRVHPSRSLFLLVIGGHVATESFMCPSSGDLVDPLRNMYGGTQSPSLPGVNRFDFWGYTMLSYGYQMPFGQRGKPHSNLDPRMVIVADKGPYFEAGRVDLAKGNTVDAPRLAVRAPEFPGSAADILRLPNERWRPYNSRNHVAGEGQNVMFLDSHVEFLKRPICGVNYDNIYTQQALDYTLEGAIKGAKPQDRLGPLTNTDTIIIP